MYSLTFCVRVMSPERHHWKPAVQAAAAMLRTPPSTASHRPAIAPTSHIRRAILRTPPVTRRSPASSARRPRRAFALCCHIAGWTQACNYSSRYVAIATQPVHRLQIRPTLHNYGASPTTPPSYIRVRAIVLAYDRGQTHRHTDRHTHTRVTTIHFASFTTHAKCNFNKNYNYN